MAEKAETHKAALEAYRDFAADAVRDAETILYVHRRVINVLMSTAVNANDSGLPDITIPAVPQSTPASAIAP